MTDKSMKTNWLPPRDSNPDMLIQSQLFKITGPVQAIRQMLEMLDLYSTTFGYTVTLTPTSVPDATVGVTQDSQQNPQQWSGWIPVDDKRPPVGESILFCTNEHITEMGWFCFDGNEAIFQCERTLPQDEPIVFRLRDGRVTHWMPLPEPPDAQGSVT